MKEYGGYLELDTYRLPMLHKNALALNCGRNCLAYLIEARKISKIKLPYYMCSSIIEVCKRYGVHITYYHINEKFKPIDLDLAYDEWLYIVNYYGQISEDFLVDIKDKFGRVIIDNAQAYFCEPIVGVDTLYTCRKFLGVADGAFLYTDAKLNRLLYQDESFERMRFLLGRFERNASEFYSDNVANNSLFIKEPIKSMSKLTNNLLHGIDYEYVEQRRTNNYRIYYDGLKCINRLKLNMINGAFAYPLLVDNGANIRKELQKLKIYVPTLWPNVVEDLPHNSFEYELAMNTLPLPCDQRYDIDDMKGIVNQLGGLL